MRRIISATAAGLVAALALLGCQQRSTESSTQSTSQLAQAYLDAGYGVPNPMPGSPIADAGGAAPFTPVTPVAPPTASPTPAPTPTPAPMPAPTPLPGTMPTGGPPPSPTSP